MRSTLYASVTVGKHGHAQFSTVHLFLPKHLCSTCSCSMPSCHMLGFPYPITGMHRRQRRKIHTTITPCRICLNPNAGGAPSSQHDFAARLGRRTDKAASNEGTIAKALNFFVAALHSVFQVGCKGTLPNLLVGSRVQLYERRADASLYCSSV